MDSNFPGSSIKGLANQPYAPISKNLTHPGTGGATGAGGADPALAQWYDQAVYYNNWYQGVISGQIQLQPGEKMPTDAEYQFFLQNLQYASNTLGYAQPGWDPSMGGQQGPMGPMGPGGPMQPGQQTNQFGGISGTQDNWTYTDEKTRIGFTGTGTHDIWSNDITIEVAPTSANVVVENTNDPRFGGESVVKITVTDPATGTTATYFVHDYDPTKDKIKINTPDSASQVVNNTGDASITTGKFTPGGKAGAGTKPDASIEGVVQDNGNILYQPEWAGGGTVDFWANPGESQIHEIYSNANITVGASDKVNVTMEGDVLVVTVTRTTGEFAGTTDTYKIQKGFKLENINVTPGSITFADVEPTDGAIPAAFQDRVTALNGGVAAEGAAGATADAQAIVDSLQTNLTGNKDNQLLSALKMAGYKNADGTEIKTIEDFKKLIPDKFPGTPDDRLIKLLKILDPDGLGQAISKEATPHDSKDDAKLQKAVTDILMELLRPLYPNEIISRGSKNDYSIDITGTIYEWGTANGESSLSPE